jgi:hypothetical protein
MLELNFLKALYKIWKFKEGLKAKYCLGRIL